MPRYVILATAALAISLTTSAESQSVRATSGPTVMRVSPERIKEATQRMPRPVTRAKPELAVIAQRVMSLPTPPPVNDVAVFDASHLDSGQNSMWLDRVTLASSYGAPILLLGLDGAQSRINIGFPAGPQAMMADCDLTPSFGAGVPVSASFVAYKSLAGSSTPTFAGTSSLSNGHVTVAVPPTGLPSGTRVTLEITIKGTWPSSSDFLILRSCRLYRLG